MAQTSSSVELPNAWLVAAVSCLVPGGGHFMLGLTRKATILCVVLLFMTAIGLAFGRPAATEGRA